MPIPALVMGAASLAGGYLANRGRRKESGKNRAFQERMRNTQWQSAVRDMEQAGINPALAYSQGPNAAPGGNMAQQQDAISPAVSSTMQMKRMSADLQQIRASTEKLKHEGRAADAAADLSTATNFAWGLTKSPSGALRINNEKGSGGYSWLTRRIRGEVAQTEARARQTGLMGNIAQPLSDLSGRMGEVLPILSLLSMASPGGILRGGARKGGAFLAATRARVAREARRVPGRRR